jgi:hypothetical protein
MQLNLAFSSDRIIQMQRKHRLNTKYTAMFTSDLHYASRVEKLLMSTYYRITNSVQQLIKETGAMVINS